MAVGRGATNDVSWVPDLLGRVNDPNYVVAMSAVGSLVKVGATNAGSFLFAKLQTLLQSHGPPFSELQRQADAVGSGINSDSYSTRLTQLFHPRDHSFYFDRREAERAEKMKSVRASPEVSQAPYLLPDVLIHALGDLRYTLATDELFKLLGGQHDFPVGRALKKLDPERVTRELLATANDSKINSYIRERALWNLCVVSATNSIHAIVPLLDDVTPIVYTKPMSGLPWRICDRAANAICVLLQQQGRIQPIFPGLSHREDTMKRAREWAKSNPPAP